MIQPSGLIKDWDYIKKTLSTDSIGEYNIERKVDVSYSALNEFNKYIENMEKHARLLKGLSCLTLPIGIGFFGLLHHKALKEDIEKIKNQNLDGRYLSRILRVINERPSMIYDAGFNIDYLGSNRFFAIGFENKVYILYEPFLIHRFDKKPVITKGKIKSIKKGKYKINGEEMVLVDRNNLPLQHDPIFFEPERWNPDYRIKYVDEDGESSKEELQGYLKETFIDGKELYVGGKVISGVLHADLFRDDDGNAFDIYMKV